MAVGVQLDAIFYFLAKMLLKKLKKFCAVYIAVIRETDYEV